jgi:hypothetical protein
MSAVTDSGEFRVEACSDTFSTINPTHLKHREKVAVLSLSINSSLLFRPIGFIFKFKHPSTKALKNKGIRYVRCDCQTKNRIIEEQLSISGIPDDKSHPGPLASSLELQSLLN